MAKSVVFNGKDICEFKDIERKELEEGQVRTRALCSLISTGTETIVLGRKFSEGTSWDKWVQYPFYPGYSMIGEVVESRNEEIKPGTITASRTPHAGEWTVHGSSVHAVPEGVSPEMAVWFALAKITFMGARAGEVKLGSRVLVIGGGPIGQMAARWCLAAGAEKVGMVDMIDSRLRLAEAGGVCSTFNKPCDEISEEIKGFFGEKCSDGVVIDSTGNSKVLPSALRAAPDRGKVVILGDTGSPENQHITGDVINRGLKIIGAHDCHTDSVWTEERIVSLFFTLLKSGQFNIDGLNSHTFRPEDAARAYQTAETDRGSTMGMIFDWRN